MTDQYTKLADWHQAMADEPKRNQAKREKHAETARILRAAAGVDVAGLMDVADRYALAQADPAHWRSALESDLRLALAAREEPEPWVNVRGCGSHHYTPQNIAAMIRDLKAVEQGNEIPEWVNRDHRTKCGMLWRVISALSHEVPLNPDPVMADDGQPSAEQQMERAERLQTAAEEAIASIEAGMHQGAADTLRAALWSTRAAAPKGTP